MWYQAFFYVSAGGLLASAWYVVVAKNPIHSILALLGAVGCLSALLVLLGFQLLAFLQLYVYAGAVISLFLIVAMLLNLRDDAFVRIRHHFLWGCAAVGAASLAVLLIGIVVTARFGPTRLGDTIQPMTALTIKELARQLFTTYLLPFEMTSLLMLVAVIGVTSLLRNRTDS